MQNVLWSTLLELISKRFFYPGDNPLRIWSPPFISSPKTPCEDVWAQDLNAAFEKVGLDWIFGAVKMPNDMQSDRITYLSTYLATMFIEDDN